jgi:hypothetical protein
MEQSNLIGLDFETYGAVSLPDHGLERYVSDSSFTPLIACTTEYNGGQYDRRRYCLWNQHDVARLRHDLEGKRICAHNAGFEERVIRWIGGVEVAGYIDSAVLARAMGAAGKLEAAAPQLLGVDKLEDGWRLIKLFSIPSEEQLASGRRTFDPQLIEDNIQDWLTFFQYCQLDADLSLGLVVKAIASGFCTEQELRYQDVTMEMNQRGWHVDIDTVEEMQRRYLENVELEVQKFRANHDAVDLNLNSLPQLKEWCATRGIKANSFDEKNVAKLLARIKAKLDDMQAKPGFAADDPRFNDYCAVVDLLKTKQALGGSSLKKLRVILDTVSEDGRLRDQYLHVGAGQTWRTTGRSVQMQNLKRLGDEPGDMLELTDPDSEWDNDKLALNLRQCFTATHPKGRLIVGDFASVESRGLAWLANAHWKLDAYRQGKDMYKVLAAEKFGVAYDAVDKPQRTFGKVGELSCGYQAGGGAVQSFADGMGVKLTEAEAADLVYGWRDINPEIVQWWADLDAGLHTAFRTGMASVPAGYNFMVEFLQVAMPMSLQRQHPKGATSMVVILRDDQGNEYMRRVFHGVYERGRSLCYYKPSERKTGDLWSNHFTDPKTKQVKFYNIYGGKLAGILTQSLCRQMFFDRLESVDDWCNRTDGVDLVGQFHDEIVLDWSPEGGESLPVIEDMLKSSMSFTRLRGFPLTAEVKSAYRYIK